MQTVLFHEIIFGPIHSRRLGISLGVNLLPVDGKLCSFDCVYCECGYNAQGVGKSGLPSSDRVEEELKSRLQSMHEAEKKAVLTNNDYTAVAKTILEGCGGKDNIASIDNCITRLRLEVKDITQVDDKKIKSDRKSVV